MTSNQLEALMQWVNARVMLAVEERETDEPCQGYVKGEETSRSAMFAAFGFDEHILGFPVNRENNDLPAHLLKNGTKCLTSASKAKAHGMSLKVKIQEAAQYPNVVHPAGPVVWDVVAEWDNEFEMIRFAGMDAKEKAEAYAAEKYPDAPREIIPWTRAG